MRINIITLGCSKNTVDSENLASMLSCRGHSVFFDRQRNDSDITIINTCGFIGDAKEESIGVILSQIAAKQGSKKDKQLIVVGCLVQRYLDQLKEELPEVDAFFGTTDWQSVVQYIEQGHSSSSNPENFPTDTTTNSINTAPRTISTPKHYAYIKISEGCDRSCSYCAIPLIRGRHKSRPIEEIVAEGKALVAQGVKELIIIAQDTTYYGLDIYHKRMLGTLLTRMAEETGAPWIRLHYTYPSAFPDDAITAIATHRNICNYIDIPLQHINTSILKSMQRGIDREGTLQLLERMRQALPDVAIRTTLIVGYPGESEETFNELKEFVRQARFDRMGCFAYSPEEGTAAYDLADDVPEEEKQRRVAELMAVQEEISYQKNQQRIGKTFRILIDRIEGDNFIGRTEYDSPEVDDEVIVQRSNATEKWHVGDFTLVRITDALENDLLAEPVTNTY